MLVNSINADNDLDWVDIKELGAVLSTKSLPETPNINLVDTDSVSKKKIYLDTNFTHRDIEVELAVVAKTTDELRGKLTKITNQFKGKFNLIFKSNDKQMYRDVFLSKTIDVDEVTNSVYILKLNMTAYDPFRYNTVKTEVVTDNIVGTITKTIENKGNYIVKPIITLEGSADEVSVSVGGRRLTYVNLQAGNKVVIDNDKYTVVSKAAGGDINALANWRDNFIELDSGDNEVLITGKKLNLTVVVEFRDTFL